MTRSRYVLPIATTLTLLISAMLSLSSVAASLETQLEPIALYGKEILFDVERDGETVIMTGEGKVSGEHARQALAENPSFRIETTDTGPYIEYRVSLSLEDLAEDSGDAGSGEKPLREPREGANRVHGPHVLTRLDGRGTWIYCRNQCTVSREEHRHLAREPGRFGRRRRILRSEPSQERQ